MSETKHTPGPWNAVISPAGPKVYAGPMKICDVRGWVHLIGAGGLDLPFEEAEAIQDANARLMAAAPTLLDACQSALSLLENILLSGRPAPSFSDKSEVLHVLYDAIALATLPGEDEPALPENDNSIMPNNSSVMADKDTISQVHRL